MTLSQCRRSQNGLTLILSLFFTLVGVGALAVLGAGQVMFEQSRIQKVADLAALEAAKQISDGPLFPAAEELAARNMEGEEIGLTLECLLNGEPAPQGCEQATTVRATTTKSFLPFFFGQNVGLTAVAEAQNSPVIAGRLSNTLVSLSSADSAILCTLLGLGTCGSDETSALNLVLINGGGAVGLDASVPLTDLAVEVSGLQFNSSQEALTSLQTASVDFDVLVARAINLSAPDSGLATLLEPLTSGLTGRAVNLGEFLTLDLQDNSPQLLGLNLGELVRLSLLTLASGQTATGVALDAGLLPGVTLDLNVISPPKVFIANKREGVSPITQISTAQVEVLVRLETSALLGPGLSSINLGLASLTLPEDLELGLSVGQAEAIIQDIACRLPREEVTVEVKTGDVIGTACLGRAGTTGGLASNCQGAPGAARLVRLSLLGLVSEIRLGAEASIGSGAGSGDADNKPSIFVSPPYPGHTPVVFNSTLEDGLGSVLENLQLDLSVQVLGLSLPALNALAAGVLGTLNSVLPQVLSDTGNALDSVLNALGASVNDAELEITSVNCRNSVLTR